MAEARVQSMLRQIQTEGQKKVDEIREKSKNEFDEEKKKLVEEQKNIISKSHKNRMDKITRDTAIQKSMAINKQRLEKIKARQGMIAKLSENVREKLAKDLKDEGQSKPFVTKLITQGLLMLLETNVTVKCRKQDLNMVSSIVNKATEEYTAVIKEQTGASKQCKVDVDKNNFLPETSLGGVILSCHDGNITVDNTIDVRLKLVMEQDKPAIRRLLFPASRSAS